MLVQAATRSRTNAGEGLLGNDPEKDEADKVIVTNVVEAAIIFVEPCGMRVSSASGA